MNSNNLENLQSKSSINKSNTYTLEYHKYIDELETSLNKYEEEEESENNAKLREKIQRQSIQFFDIKSIKQIGNYLINSELGSGAFGKVYLGTHIPTNIPVAIKILNKFLLNQTPEDYELVNQELSILKIVKHRYIAQLYEIIETPQHIFIIMEYCEGKDLMDYILRKNKLSEIESNKFFRQLIIALIYLHKQNITHRDIKIDNMLLDKNNDLKLVDFGLSTKYNINNITLDQPCGTVVYAAPEVLEGKEYDGMLIDVWSSGIVLYGLLAGYLPFNDTDDLVNKKNVIAGKIEYPSFFSKNVVDLLSHMLETNEKKRYRLEDIIKHKWYISKNSENNYDIIPGIVIGYNNVPIDENALNLCSGYDYDKEKIRKAVLENKCNEYDAIYYLIVKKMGIDGFESISDFKCNKFIEFIKNDNNNIIKEINSDFNEEDENLKLKSTFSSRELKHKNSNEKSNKLSSNTSLGILKKKSVEMNNLPKKKKYKHCRGKSDFLTVVKDKDLINLINNNKKSNNKHKYNPSLTNENKFKKNENFKKNNKTIEKNDDKNKLVVNKNKNLQTERAKHSKDSKSIDVNDLSKENLIKNNKKKLNKKEKTNPNLHNKDFINNHNKNKSIQNKSKSKNKNNNNNNNNSKDSTDYSKENKNHKDLSKEKNKEENNYLKNKKIKENKDDNKENKVNKEKNKESYKENKKIKKIIKENKNDEKKNNNKEEINNKNNNDLKEKENKKEENNIQNNNDNNNKKEKEEIKTENNNNNNNNDINNNINNNNNDNINNENKNEEIEQKEEKIKVNIQKEEEEKEKEKEEENKINELINKSINNTEFLNNIQEEKPKRSSIKTNPSPHSKNNIKNNNNNNNNSNKKKKSNLQSIKKTKKVKNLFLNSAENTNSITSRNQTLENKISKTYVTDNYNNNNKKFKILHTDNSNKVFYSPKKINEITNRLFTSYGKRPSLKNNNNNNSNNNILTKSPMSTATLKNNSLNNSIQIEVNKSIPLISSNEHRNYHSNIKLDCIPDDDYDEDEKNNENNNNILLTSSELNNNINSNTLLTSTEFNDNTYIEEISIISKILPKKNLNNSHQENDFIRVNSNRKKTYEYSSKTYNSNTKNNNNENKLDKTSIDKKKPNQKSQKIIFNKKNLNNFSQKQQQQQQKYKKQLSLNNNEKKNNNNNNINKIHKKTINKKNLESSVLTLRNVNKSPHLIRDISDSPKQYLLNEKTRLSRIPWKEKKKGLDLDLTSDDIYNKYINKVKNNNNLKNKINNINKKKVNNIAKINKDNIPTSPSGNLKKISYNFSKNSQKNSISSLTNSSGINNNNNNNKNNFHSNHIINEVGLPIYNGPIDLFFVEFNSISLNECIKTVYDKLKKFNYRIIKMKQNKLKCSNKNVNFEIDIYQLNNNCNKKLYYYKVKIKKKSNKNEYNSIIFNIFDK